MNAAADRRSIRGRVALVTGAASGMGRATAELFAAEGARVAAVDRSGAALAEVVAGIGRRGGLAVALEADLADRGAVAAVVDSGREELGPVDIVVNCAGVSRPAALGDAAWADAWDETVAVNLTAPALVVRHCLADLAREGQGRVVNVASTEGLGATRFLSPYTASKHGVIGLTRSLAVELAEAGITVNCVCPGPIHTAMTAPIPDDDKRRFARRRVPLRRYGEPEEVAQMILSLVLPAAGYTTGAVLTVDGGLTVQNT